MDATSQVKTFWQEVKIKNECGGKIRIFLAFIQLKLETDDFWTEAFITHKVRSTRRTSETAQGQLPTIFLRMKQRSPGTCRSINVNSCLKEKKEKKHD